MTRAFGSLILFSSRIEEMLSFYRSIGLALEQETHDEGGPLHYACDLGDVHIALYRSAGGDAPRWREGGCTWPGFVVDELASALARLTALGATILSGPEDRPWGTRAVVEDPDGRPVELWSAVRPDSEN